MNSKEATEYIQHIEEKYDLLQYQVDGWAVWPLFRFSVAGSLRNLPDRSYVNRRLGIIKRLGFIFKDVISLFSLNSTRYVVIASSLNRRIKVGDKYRDVYFDILLRKLGTFTKLEHTHSRQFLVNSRRAEIPSNMTTNFIELGSHMRSRVPYPFGVNRLAKSLELVLRKENISNVNASRIARGIRAFLWNKKMYEYIFRKISPDYLLMINTYGDLSPVAAAKELGIQVVELQHGFINRHHIGYAWSQYAIPYKASLLIPDKFLLYGDYWESELRKNGFWDGELKVVGSSQIDFYRKKPIHRSGKRCMMVVTTQNLDRKRLTEFLKNFLDISHAHLDCDLFIKLHQGESNTQFYTERFINYPNVHVIPGASSPATLDLLKQAHIHVSIFSTCHYEAIALGTPTTIIPLTGYENVLHLHKNGHAFLVDTPHDLFLLALQWRNLAVDDTVGEFYFKRNAVINMERLLR